MILSLVNILSLKSIFKGRKNKRQAGRNEGYNWSKQMTIMVAVVAQLWTGGFGVWNPVEALFQIGSVAHPASYVMGIGSLSRD